MKEAHHVLEDAQQAAAEAAKIRASEVAELQKLMQDSKLEKENLAEQMKQMTQHEAERERAAREKVWDGM